MHDIDLAQCRIIAPENPVGFVRQAVEDLIEWTGGQLTDAVAPQDSGAVVVVGKETVRRTAASFRILSEIGLDGLSDQGFLLKTVRADGIDFVLCSGGGGRGDAYAVIELIKALDVRGGRALVPQQDRREEPYFLRRGMYAHQHWAYNYPYALRTWELEDWKRYIDLLAYLKINVFSIWSMVGILPSPLSEGDRRYLENYHEIIDYARNRRGMEVYIGEAANNVAETDGGQPVQSRDYFEVEVLKNPADPKEFQEIMDNRRSLYEVAGNADGYWIIDSDPGGFDKSPTREFVDLLLGNRQLIDQCTEKGRNAKIFYWMWVGWGNKDKDGNAREAVELMRDRLKEPWMLFTCWGSHLDIAHDMGLMHKAIFFPYGTIEDEPSPPTTRLRFDEMYFHLNNCISYWGGRSAMGNAQSPVVQLPNIYFFAQTAWHGVPPVEPAEEDVTSPLARLVAPDTADELSAAWLALKERDPERTFAAAEGLRRIVEADAVGRAGALGRYYFPGIKKLLSDLALQLDVHGCARLLCQTLSRPADQAEVMRRLLDYHTAALKWYEQHHFRRCHCYGPDVIEIAELWRAYREKHPLPENYMADLKQELVNRGHDESAVDGYIALTGPK